MSNSGGRKAKNTTDELQAWAAQQLERLGHGALKQFDVLSGDASFRRYARAHTADGSYIAVHAPPETEKNTEFNAMARLLGQAGIRVPQVLAFEESSGFFLQSDLGDTLLLSQLTAESVDHWYRKALDCLASIQNIAARQDLRHYTAAQMHEDLQRFPQWFVEGLLKHSMNGQEAQLYEQFCQSIIALCQQQSTALTHYDYQSRNLMVCGDGELGVIDFQDALIAPMTYDLASVLRDCYVKWPAEQVQSWACEFAEQARKDGRLGRDIDDQQFMQWFDAMSLQRHVRVLGTFARLFLRDSKPGYLGDIPLVCLYVEEVIAEHAELSEFAGWFSNTLLPLARRCEWWDEQQLAVHHEVSGA